MHICNDRQQAAEYFSITLSSHLHVNLIKQILGPKSVPIYLLRTNLVLSPGPSAFTYMGRLFLKTTHTLSSVKNNCAYCF